jgi:hypothetical protein
MVLYLNSKEKTEFRQSKEWKEFRKKIIVAHNYQCDICEYSSKKLHVHHKREELYTILNPDWFSVLCPVCHKYIEHHHRKKKLNEKVKNFIAPYFE